jgi:hypothetical protein
LYIPCSVSSVKLNWMKLVWNEEKNFVLKFLS